MKTIEQIINDETKLRLDEMSKADYVFPQTADKKDFVAIVLSIAVCILLIGLCMIGVIK